MTDVSSFLYRLPRFDVDLPFDLILPDRNVIGRCRNVSDSGVGAQLNQPVSTGAKGTIRLRPGNYTLELSALVTYSDGLEAGIHFLFRSEEEREFVRAMVLALSGSTVLD